MKAPRLIRELVLPWAFAAAIGTSPLHASAAEAWPPRTAPQVPDRGTTARKKKRTPRALPEPAATPMLTARPTPQPEPAPVEQPSEPRTQPEEAAPPSEPAGGPAPLKVPDSFATIRFKNQTGKAVTLTEVLFTFDGKPLPMIVDVKPDQDIVIYSGRLTPGTHLMQTEMRLKGNSRGPITYTKCYKFRVTAEQVLTLPQGKSVVFTIAGIGNNGMTVPFSKQLDFKMTAVKTPPLAPKTQPQLVATASSSRAP